MILTIMFIPYEMHMNIDSIFRSIYRMITKTKLLEWVTAEDGEKRLENTLKNHFKIMKANLIFGIIFILFGNFIGKLFGVLFIFGIFRYIFWNSVLQSWKKPSERVAPTAFWRFLRFFVSFPMVGHGALYVSGDLLL